MAPTIKATHIPIARKVKIVFKGLYIRNTTQVRQYPSIIPHTHTTTF